MERGRITELVGLDAERARWERLYALDPRAQMFVSWPWLRAYLSANDQRWIVLTLHDGDQLVAALPLAIRPTPLPLLPIARELTFATDPVGDYGGMLCLPGAENAAASAFGEEIMRLRWDRAAFRDVVDQRVDLVVAALRTRGAQIESDPDARSFQIPLPATWDAYLAMLGGNTRRKIRELLKGLDTKLPGFRVSYPTTAEELETHLDALSSLHHGRWGGNLAKARQRRGRLFRAAFANDCLYLVVLWDGDRPIAANACFVDAVRKLVGGYQTAFDPAYGRFSPGKASIMIGIRDAIARGYRTFDFLRGDEDYKRSYTTQTTVRTNVRVVRRGLRSTAYDIVQPWYRYAKAAAVRVVYGPGRTF